MSCRVNFGRVNKSGKLNFMLWRGKLNEYWILDKKQDGRHE